MLWVWLLLSEAAGEDGLAKSERRLIIREESSPRGDSLVRSYVSTSMSRAFSSTSSFDGGRPERDEDEDDVKRENDKTPDDRKSTIRIRNNETVDLSKNTVPVLRYPGPTEPSQVKDKYRRTTLLPQESTPLRKASLAGKLRRNSTRSRPADLTTLLAFNALTTPEAAPQRVTTRPRPLPYPSTTQLAESMPPTAWALAGLRGPSHPPTKRQGASNIRPFVSWSTRLNKPTTPPPTTTGTSSYQ